MDKTLPFPVSLILANAKNSSACDALITYMLKAAG